MGITVFVRNLSRRSFLVLLFCVGSVANASTFEHRNWLEDFAQLKMELARSYANLDDLVKHRKLDLAALDARALVEFNRAETDEDAARAIRSLLNEFGDGHLRLLPAAPSSNVATKITAATANSASQPVQAGRCADLGYRAPRESGLYWKSSKDFTPLGTPDDLHFPAGAVALGESRLVGLIRIRLFGEDGYPAICSQILARKSSCDSKCERTLAIEVGAEMSNALARQVRALIAKQITALVVDVTGNGGGSEWVEAAMRIFAATGLESPRVGFVKHPHWEKHFQNRIHDIDLDLKRADLAESLRQSLVAARGRATAAQAIAASSCDRSGVWHGDTGCASLASTGLATTGDFAARPPFALDGLDAGWVLFAPHRYPNLDGTYRGPLAILVDANTASAAEQFAAALKDYGGATLIGRKTYGAGCGYTNGGIPITLNHSKMRLRVPDCARLRIDGSKDGSNEVFGISPDFVAATTSESAYLRLIAEWAQRVEKQ